MQLVKLVVKKSITDEIIREIKFNKKGLSLIVDETNELSSGSNIGKTTAVKIIDLCLGAQSVSSLYKEKDTGENSIIGKFLNKYKVIAELTCEIKNKEHIFKRALYKYGKNGIDGEDVKNITQYRSDLKKIIFDDSNEKPSLRQLISKFIRLENANENASKIVKLLQTLEDLDDVQNVYANFQIDDEILEKAANE